MKKRVCKIIVAITLLALMLCGCGASKEPKETYIESNEKISVEKNIVSDAEKNMEPLTEEVPKQEKSEETSPEPEEKTESPTPVTSSEQLADEPRTEKASDKEDETLYCTISVECKTILSNMENLKSEKKAFVPQDGIILEAQSVAFSSGESVFDVLQRAIRENILHMEFSKAPAFNSVYIEGINNLYEFDCGDLSGWVYSVNGEITNYACSDCKVMSGDEIKWMYTCNRGRDLVEKTE